MLRFKKKKVFGGCKNQIFFIGDQNVGRGDRMAEVRIRSERHGDASWGQEVLLEIWRLGGHFSGAHGASASLPRPGRVAVSLPP